MLNGLKRSLVEGLVSFGIILEATNESGEMEKQTSEEANEFKFYMQHTSSHTVSFVPFYN